MELNISLHAKLVSLKSSLPAIVLNDHFILRPDMAQQYSEHQKENFKKDIVWILSFLSESIWANQPVLFEEFVSWLKTFLHSLKVPMKDVAESFELMQKRINLICNKKENAIINQILNNAIGVVLSGDENVSIPVNRNDLSGLAHDYLNHLLKGERTKALSRILDEVESGTPVQDIYINVFQPVQYEIGRMWQTNKISVAHEHFCTCATQLVMSQLYRYMFTGPKKNRKIVTTCVPGELHEMGARMVSDFFEMNGWDSYYLGANMPTAGVIKYLIDLKPQCLAISATMTFHVREVEEMIRKIRSSSEIPSDLTILVGGHPFIVAEGLWERIGADGSAMSALEAVRMADLLTAPII